MLILTLILAPLAEWKCSAAELVFVLYCERDRVSQGAISWQQGGGIGLSLWVPVSSRDPPPQASFGLQFHKRWEQSRNLGRGILKK